MRGTVITLGACAGFAAVFMATSFIDVWHNQDAECDGVCTDMFPIIGALALTLGVLGALGGGFATAALYDRRKRPF